ncbi:hypothetical protein [Aliikangiella coralliicola]|uniref:DUF2846 domain-containing protein n=1 Tax=Aliikangiella coralliicola TaxID=2592383 RepID=A0A545U4Q4_9GAMM|nr:hypothetical protein [Aliikangiella coralliicola]TQV84446.1 hypothetical protein FLL46_22785 [Aliikangiella coralliicola]
MNKFVVVAFLIFIISACSPSRVSVMSTQQIDNPEKIRQKTLLLFAIDSQAYIKEIHLSGKKNLVVEAKPYQVISLPPGEYQISKLDFGRGYISLEDSRFPETWKFDVKRGALNYIGHIYVQHLGNNYYNYDLLNQSTAAVKYLENEQPLLLKNTVLNYGGKDRDDFISYALSLIAAEKNKKLEGGEAVNNPEREKVERSQIPAPEKHQQKEAGASHE